MPTRLAALDALTSSTPSIWVSAFCTAFSQPPHVIPVTVS
jgi:hypothetical protein